MSTRNNATEHSVGHGNQSSILHGIDVEKNKELQHQRKANKTEPRKVVPDYEEPVFRSDVSALGGGKCFRITRGQAILMDGKEWEQSLWEAARDMNWYHQAQKGKAGKIIYKRRKIKDRIKLSPTDKHQRPQTDVARQTIDLRPDISRAVQYMLEAGMKKEAASLTASALQFKIQLFEKFYPGRRIIFTGEHDDAGQHHDDLWHTGIIECTDEKIKGRENGKVVNRSKRERTPFVICGVGVGAAYWSRHFSALRDTGYSPEDIKSFASRTLVALQEDTETVIERYRCKPRDVCLFAVLDRLVYRKLQKLAPEIAKRANLEYAQFLKENYCAGKIGVKQSKSKRLEQELASEKVRSTHFETKASEERVRADTIDAEAFSVYRDILEERDRVLKNLELEKLLNQSKSGQIERLQESLEIEKELTTILDHDCQFEREKALRLNIEATATLNHLDPTDGESMESAVSRVVQERNLARMKLAGIVNEIRVFISHLVTSGVGKLVCKWSPLVQRSLKSLQEFAGVKADLTRDTTPDFTAANAMEL